MTPVRFDVVIVGAGPAGSTAAILLARAGWSVALVEKQQFPRRKVCGDCIAASNLGLIDALGLGDPFRALAGPALRQVALMGGPTTLIADLPASANPQHPWGRALGRESLDAMLLDQARAAGARVFQPCMALSLTGPAGDQRLRLRDLVSGAQLLLQAPVAILAHGSLRTLPADRGDPRRARRGSDLLSFKANFSGAQLAPSLLPVLCFKGGYGGLVVADQGLTTVACCIRADRLDALRRASPGQSAGEVVEAMLKRDCAGLALALRTAQRDGAWLASGPLFPGVHRQRSDAAFCIGNAAGEAHPIIGEGMSMAMQSAWLLCSHLLQANRPTGLAAPDTAASPSFSPSVSPSVSPSFSPSFSRTANSSVSSPASSAASSAAAQAAGRWQVGVQRRYRADWRRLFAPRLRLAAAFAHLAMRPALWAPILALLRMRPGLLAWGAQRITRWAGKLDCALDPATVTQLAASPRRAGQPTAGAATRT